MTSNWKIWVAMVAVAIIALIGWYYPGSDTSVAGVTNYDSIETEALAVGDGCDNEGNTCTGTTHTKFLSGTCTLTQSSVGSFGTTSKEHYCAVSGVAAGDKVFVSLPAGSQAGSNNGGFAVTAAYATATDMIGVFIANNSGVATSSYRQATTSVPYWIVD